MINNKETQSEAMLPEFAKVLNGETTSVEDKDPDVSTFEIPGHNILLRPLHVQEKTKSGIILAPKTTYDAQYLMNVCKVLKLGRTAYTQDIFKDSGPYCKEGDYILIPKLSGQKVCYKSTPLVLLACDKVLAVIADPSDIDPHFNLNTTAY